MALGFNTTIRNARLDQITAAAGANALMRIFSGTRPSNGGSTAGCTQLAQLTLNAVFAAAAVAGVLTLNAITSDLSADAGGLASWFRIVKADGTTFVLDGSVGLAGSGVGDLLLDDVNIILGGTVAVSTARITDGNAGI